MFDPPSPCNNITNSYVERSEKLDGIERRDMVVLELIETEENYVHNLQLLIKGFVTPLRNSKVRDFYKILLVIQLDLDLPGCLMHGS